MSNVFSRKDQNTVTQVKADVKLKNALSRSYVVPPCRVNRNIVLNLLGGIYSDFSSSYLTQQHTFFHSRICDCTSRVCVSMCSHNIHIFEAGCKYESHCSFRFSFRLCAGFLPNDFHWKIIYCSQ